MTIVTDDCTDHTALVAVSAAKRAEPESQSVPMVEKDNRQKAIKSLLANADQTVDDKLTTVKTAHHLDKDRFQNAFRSLMGK